MRWKTPCSKKIMQITWAEAKKRNITGVPTFIINDEYTIVGAQPEQTFVELFEKDRERNHKIDCSSTETKSSYNSYFFLIYLMCLFRRHDLEPITRVTVSR